MNESRYTVEIRVSIRDKQMGYQGISLEENLNIDALDFTEIAGILGEVHKTAQTIKRLKGSE